MDDRFRSELAFSLIRDVNAVLDQMNIGIGEPVVAGFSGGPDSAALASVLAYLQRKGRIRAICCHLNHQLRGDDSEADEQFVKAFSEREKIISEIKKIDIGHLASQKGMNIEAAGRVCRYEWFHETAGKMGARLVLLAHHADDQAETVIWRMMRGAGSDGLGGMRQIRQENGIFFGRPFLHRRKAELLAFCSEAGVGYRSDLSNLDVTYTRNAIRHELIPLMEKFNPNLVKQLVQTASILADEDLWMQGQAEDWVKRHVILSRLNPFAKWSCEAMNRLPIALQRRVIKLILSHLSLKNEAVSFRLIESLMNAMQPGGAPNQQVTVSGDYRLMRVYDVLQIDSVCYPEKADYSYEWYPARDRLFMIPGLPGRLISEVVLPESGITTGLDQAHSIEIPFREHQQECLTIRNRRSGDRMVWFKNGSRKKVKDAWIDAKWPAWQRAVWPMVVSQDGNILWIPGFRKAANLPHVPADMQKLLIRWEPATEDADFST